MQIAGTQKVALVTGGTAGVGLSMVRDLVADGAFVHFVGTNAAKGQRIEQALNAANPVCRFIALDLSRLRDVQAFARRFVDAVPRLDVLANNAGVMLPARQVTDEGNEMTFAIDHLAALVLCQGLRPALARANHARILNVSGSPSHLLKPSLDFDNLQLERRYSLIRAAINAVHAKTVMTEILAERFAPDGIDVNAFHPGGVKSDLSRDMRFPLRQIVGFARLFMSSESTCGKYVSTSDAVTGMTGQLFVKSRPRPLRFERDYKDQLWRCSQQIVARSTGG